MAAKPKKKAKVRKVAIRELNNRRWWRLAEVYKRLLRRTNKYAAKDLMDGLKSGEPPPEDGKPRCVRRIETDLKYCEELPPSFWRSLQWPGKLYFDRVLKYDPEIYVWQPWEVWKVLQAPEESERDKPERKRAKGGGSKPMYTDKQIELGQAVYRELREDPHWRSATQEAVAKRVQEKAKLPGNWKTVRRNIIEPVDAELRAE
jgi:hypothetical protein